MNAIDKIRKIFCSAYDPAIYEEAPNKNDLNLVEFDEDNLKFCQMVFSPDPVTGNPMSEVAYMLSGADDGFKQYLKDKLFTPVPQGSLADNPDEAMALVKKASYTPEQYNDAIHDYVLNMMREPEKGGD